MISTPPTSFQSMLYCNRDSEIGLLGCGQAEPHILLEYFSRGIERHNCSLRRRSVGAGSGVVTVQLYRREHNSYISPACCPGEPGSGRSGTSGGRMDRRMKILEKAGRAAPIISVGEHPAVGRVELFKACRTEPCRSFRFNGFAGVEEIG